MKRLTAILLALLLTLAALPAGAELFKSSAPAADGPVDGLEAEKLIEQGERAYDGTLDPDACIVLIDADRGTVLFEQNPNRLAYPASTTKIMSTLIAVESGDLDRLYTVGAEVNIGSGWSTMTPALAEGETISLRDMVYGAMLPSGCEASAAIGVAVGGSEPVFVDWMNRRAAALGMNGTHFVNTNGMSDTNHYSSAMDICRLAREAMRNEEFAVVAGTYRYVTAATNFNGPRTLTNTNYLIDPSSQYYYQYANGIKTGTTNQGRFCLTAQAVKNGRRLICVILRAPSDAARYGYAKNLFNWGFEHCADDDTEFFWQDISQVNKIMRVASSAYYYYAPAESAEYRLGTAAADRQFLIQYAAKDTEGALWYFTSEGYFIPAAGFEDADPSPVWGFCEDICRPLPSGNIAEGGTVQVGGTLYADHYIDSVTIGVVNAAGETVLSFAAEPYCTYYNVDELVGTLDLSALPSGEYLFEITGESNGEAYTVSSSFAIIGDCTVTFYDNDYTILLQTEVAYGGSAIPPEPPEHEGLIFLCWHGEYEHVTSDSMVVAVYYAVPCTVTFVGYGGVVLKTQVVAYGSAAQPPEPPEVEGMRFVGWDADYTRVTQDITITALYVDDTSLPGDVNGDGQISFTDISVLYGCLLGTGELDPAFAANADFDGDGSVTFNDVGALYYYCLGTD